MAINTKLPELTEEQLSNPDLDDDGELDVEHYPLGEADTEDPYLAEVWEAAGKLLEQGSIDPDEDEDEEEGWDELEKGLGDTVQSAGRWLAEKWQELESRYGRKGALTAAVAMLATAPVPGSIPAIIAIAEGIRGLHGYFNKHCRGLVLKASEAQVLQAMNEIGYGQTKFTSIAALGRRLGGDPASLHRTLMDLWRARKITVSAPEGRFGSTEEDRRWWMHDHGDVLGNVMLRL